VHTDVCHGWIKRSSHSKAFTFGFGNNKRIVLFDTLMEQVSNDEILDILGHELGHKKLGHTLTNFGVTQMFFGVALLLLSQCYTARDWYMAFGFDNPSEDSYGDCVDVVLPNPMGTGR
jgi:STE24 endopeptidase